MARVLFFVAVLLAAAALVAEAKVNEADPLPPVPAPAPAVSTPVPAPAPTVGTPAPTVGTPVPAPAPAPDSSDESATFPFKLILRNVAERNVTFKLGSWSFEPVLTKEHPWSAFGPFNVSLKNPVVQVTVKVKNYQGTELTETAPLNLLEHSLQTTAQGYKYLVLTASDSWSWTTGNNVLIKISHNEVLLTFKL